MAVYLTNSFEGGTNNATVTAGNSGGASGNAFDTVALGASATLVYSNTEAAHGTLSGKFTEPGTAVSCYVAWGASLTATSIPTVYYRAYLYLPSLPGTTNSRFINVLTTGNSLCGAIAITTAGKVAIQSGTGDTTQFTSTNSVPTNAWFRLEGFVTGNTSTGQMSMALYNTPDSLVATESNTTAANLNTTGAVTGIRYGLNVQDTSYTWYMDDLGASDTGLLGPSQLTGTGTGAITLAATSTGTPSFGGVKIHNPSIIPVLRAADLI